MADFIVEYGTNTQSVLHTCRTHVVGALAGMCSGDVAYLVYEDSRTQVCWARAQLGDEVYDEWPQSGAAFEKSFEVRTIEFCKPFEVLAKMMSHLVEVNYAIDDAGVMQRMLKAYCDELSGCIETERALSAKVQPVMEVVFQGERISSDACVWAQLGVSKSCKAEAVSWLERFGIWCESLVR